MTFGATRVGTAIPQHARSASDVVAKARIFHAVDPAAVASASERLPRVDFSAGQTIYVEGEIEDRLYIVVSGEFKLTRSCADGRTLLLAVVGPSDVFGDLSVFDPGPRTASATALTKASAVMMDRATLRIWLNAHPEVAKRLLRVLARRLRRTDDDLSDLIFTDVPCRVAKQLLRLTQRFGVRQGSSVRVDHGLSQEEIAQLVGSSRETVNKIMTDFARRRWIRLKGKSLLVTDSASLVRRARLTAIPNPGGA
ncbi:MAG: regulatory protein [Mycobacterium sp.]|nr:regulatory protein [Mycobacterium sp.]